jgi:PAS domain S-box-containing protein
MRTKPKADLAEENKALRERGTELEGASANYQDKAQAPDCEQDKFDMLFESIADGVAVTDAYGNIVRANQALVRLHKFSCKEDIIGKNALQLVAEKDRARTAEDIAGILQEGHVATKEYALVTADGGELDAHITTSPLVDSSGNPTGVIAVIRDVTDRRRMEEALREAKDNLEGRVAQRTADLAKANEDLRDSEERFRTLIEGSSDAIAIFDRDGTIVYESPSVERILGYTPGDLMGKSLIDQLHPDDLASVSDVFAQILNKPYESMSLQVRFRHRDGSWRWMEGTGRNLLEDPRIKGIVCNYRDITERRLAENESQRQRRYFESILNLSSEGIVILRPDMTIGFISSRAREIAGYVGDNTVASGTMGFDFIHPEDQPRLMDVFMRELQNPDPGMPVFIEFRSRRSDGSWQWFECAATSLFHNPDIEGMVINLRDITERKAAEQALRDSEERFRALIENAVDAIDIVGPDGTIIYESPSAKRISGYAEGHSGESMLEYIHPEDVPSITANMMEILSAPGRTEHIEMRVRYADGAWHWIEGTGKNLLSTPHIGGIVCNYRDVTDRKRREQELREYAMALSTNNIELDAAREELTELNQHLEDKVSERTAEVARLVAQKDEFIIRLGHDLKSPLTPLMALLPMMRDEEPDSEKREMLDLLITNVSFMRDVVIKTLRLARLSAPASGFSPEPICLAHVVRSIIEQRELVATQSGVSIHIDVDDSIVLETDKLGLEEVVDNLVLNAVKFTEEGGTINVRAEQRDDVVTVSVIDTGIGMTEEQLAHVFDEFYKADPSRSDLESSGLGMSICRRIVERHGGTIWAESPGLGQGSSVHFTLPPAKANEQSEETPVEAS